MPPDHALILDTRLQLGPLELHLRLHAADAVDFPIEEFERRLGTFCLPPSDRQADIALKLSCPEATWPRPGRPILERLKATALPEGGYSLERWDLHAQSNAAGDEVVATISPAVASVEECLRWSLWRRLAEGQPTGMLIHAASTVHEGGGWLFPAYSGTGKSTLARLTPGELVLSDELSLLSMDGEGQPWLWPSPFFNSEVAFEGDSRQARAPVSLQRIAFIAQAPTTRFRAVSGDEALVRLLQQVVHYDLGSDGAAAVQSSWLQTALATLEALPPGAAGLLELQKGASPYIDADEFGLENHEVPS